MIKVVIVEDSEKIRFGLKLLIDGTSSYKCVGDYETCEDMFEKVEDLKPDVVLMDIDLPGMSGIEGIRKLRQIFHDLRILVLTVYDESDTVFQALCAGACGYMVKKTPPTRLLEAINEAFKGGSPMSSHIARKVVGFFQENDSLFKKREDISLTKREREVLTGLVDGNSYKAIANVLDISIDTVKFHFRNIYKKLHVHSQSEAVAKAIKEKLI